MGKSASGSFRAVEEEDAAAASADRLVVREKDVISRLLLAPVKAFVNNSLRLRCCCSNRTDDGSNLLVCSGSILGWWLHLNTKPWLSKQDASRMLIKRPWESSIMSILLLSYDDIKHHQKRKG
mmetsp:Transcript_6592/g.12426  ORF Transcript_6592/g.12426 Transcript_6592/m.12426 type:complete len:123 (-) Transcript_6592:66-434(-)